MSDDAARVIRELFPLSEARTRDAAEKLARLEALGKASAAAAVTYRCRRHCTLARAYATVQGVVVHQPRYRLSPSLNAQTSSPAGRANNTEDGDRRWRAQTFFLGQAENVTVNCDHVQGIVLATSDIDADVRATRGDVILPRF